VFTVLGAVAEMEGSLIVERVKARLRNDCRPPRTGPWLEGDCHRNGRWRRNSLWTREIGFKNSGKGFGTLGHHVSNDLLQQASYFLENGDFRVGRGYVAASWRLSTLSRYLALQKLDLASQVNRGPSKPTGHPGSSSEIPTL
jgi:hypothetical protein